MRLNLHRGGIEKKYIALPLTNLQVCHILSPVSDGADREKESDMTATANTMNLIKKWDDVIFIREEGEGRILVARDSWFKTMNSWETYNTYGQIGEHECSTPGECECEDEVKAHNYWNGHNYASVIIQADNYDTRFTEVDDEDEIDRYTEALENAEFSRESTGRQYYRANGLEITDSQWQGDWELYSIAEEER